MKEYIDGKNIVREIYELPNGKIYLKIDTDFLKQETYPEKQLHIQLDETELLTINQEAIKLMTIRGLKDFVKK